MSHLNDVKQTYFEHMKNSFGYALLSFYAGTIFIIHGIFPDILVHDGTYTILLLEENLQTKKNNIKLY